MLQRRPPQFSVSDRVSDHASENSVHHEVLAAVPRPLGDCDSAPSRRLSTTSQPFVVCAMHLEHTLLSMLNRPQPNVRLTSLRLPHIYSRSRLLLVPVTARLRKTVAAQQARASTKPSPTTRISIVEFAFFVLQPHDTVADKGQNASIYP